MKYSKLPENQAKSLLDLYIKIYDVSFQEQKEYSISGFRLLLLGNGAGVAFLANAISKVYEQNSSAVNLILPISIFLIGIIAAGLAYIPIIGVATNAQKHIGESIEKFLKDELDLEKIEGWGHSAKSLFVLNLFIFISLICFIAGIVISLIKLT